MTAKRKKKRKKKSKHHKHIKRIKRALVTPHAAATIAAITWLLPSPLA